MRRRSVQAQHANSGLPSRWNTGAAFQTYAATWMMSSTTVTSTPWAAALASPRSSCVSAPSTSATHPGPQPAPCRRSSPGGVGARAAANTRHRRPARPDRRPPPSCVDRGVLAGVCVSTPGPVGAAPVRCRSHSSAGLRAKRGRLWPQRRRPRSPHTAPGRGERRLASLNSPATAGSHSGPQDGPRPSWAPHRHGGGAGPCDLNATSTAGGAQRDPEGPSRKPRRRHGHRRLLPSHEPYQNAARMFRGARRRGQTERPGAVIRPGWLPATRRVGALSGRCPPQGAPKRDRPRAKTPL